MAAKKYIILLGRAELNEFEKHFQEEHRKKYQQNTHIYWEKNTRKMFQEMFDSQIFKNIL